MQARAFRMARLPRDESGVALFGIVVLCFVMLLLILSALTIGSVDAGLAAQRTAKSRAFYLAEGGITRGLLWLEAQATTPTGADTIFPFGATPDTAGHGTYFVRLIPDSTNGANARPGYTILSTGRVKGRERTLSLHARAELFSDYLYLTDREHEPGFLRPLWFNTGDVIDGPLFTNDQISIQGDPAFIYQVASAYGGPTDDDLTHDPLFRYYNGDQFNNIESAAASNPPYDNPDFQDGFALGVPGIDYPTHSLTDDIEPLAASGGIWINGTYDIELSRVDSITGLPMYGYVSYRKTAQAWNDVEISSTNGLIYVNGSLRICGVLDGTLTIATNGSIWISDDILYRDSDVDGPRLGCNDMLGLIAGTDINIEQTTPNMTDCEIHAAMIALDNCFRADDWASGPLRGVLTVYGSISQGYRGAIGTSEIVDGEVVLLTGYSKDYHYDWRLLEQSPPYFHSFFGTGVYTRGRWREIEG
jgi:hypothetical protein